MLSILWALIPTRYLYTAGAALAALLLAWAAIAHHQHSLKAEYFQRGYAVAHDSAVEATIVRLAAQHARDTLRADSSAKAARDGTTALIPQRVRFDSAVAARHPLRLEPLPDSERSYAAVQRCNGDLDCEIAHSPPLCAVAPAPLCQKPSTDMVRVTVESTNEVYDIPAGAAREWFVADSLVAVAAKLLDKYVVANRQWSEAWNDEHTARISADSLVALYAERLRSVSVPPAAKSHRLVYATIGAVVALIARNQIHR